MIVPDMSFDRKSAMAYWGLHLLSCYITTARKKKYLLDILGSDGAVDALEGMGQPTFENRTITASFQAIDSHPQDTVDRLLNDLEGRTVQIVLPDKPNYYMTGTIHVCCAGYRPGADITITADCMPWRYAIQAVKHTIPASETDVQYTWRNSGTRLAVPEITVAGDDVNIIIDGVAKTLAMGSHLVPDLAIPGHGTITVLVSGGEMNVKYREAIL